MGGGLGVVVAFAGVRGLVALAPAGLPRLAAIQVSAPVLLFALMGVGLATWAATHHGRRSA